MLSDKGATTIIYVVTAIWAANMLVSMIPAADYQPDPALHGIFTLIVGGAFALKNKNSGGPPPGGEHRR